MSINDDTKIGVRVFIFRTEPPDLLDLSNTDAPYSQTNNTGNILAFDDVQTMGRKEERYDDRYFHGLLVDARAAGHSTAGIGQLKHSSAYENVYRLISQRLVYLKIQEFEKECFRQSARFLLIRQLVALTFMRYLVMFCFYLVSKIKTS